MQEKMFRTHDKMYELQERDDLQGRFDEK